MEILLALGVFAACFALMAIGLILKRGRLCFKGSCGGPDSCSCSGNGDKS